jgi:hypothetical protein
MQKIEKGLLPIYAKDMRRYIKYAEQWGYDNKDAMNYVAEAVTDDLDCDYHDQIKGDDYFFQVKSLANDMIDGSKFYNIKLEK